MKTVIAHGSTRCLQVFALALGLIAAAHMQPATAVVSIDSKPLTVATPVPGNLVLVPSVEWPTVVTQANDPGVAETSANYTPATAYAGYFNVNLCYAYHYDPIEANRYFYPVVATGTNHSCAGKTGGTPTRNLWSGNFLNWASTQAIDTFRLALTGGYRVHRPADGTPPNVTVTVATADGFTTVTKATSEMPNVTYLEKANSDRWDNGYTKLRRLTTQTNVAATTPSATAGLRTRIGALRNQMWFIPSVSDTTDCAGNPLPSTSLGKCAAYDNPRPLPLPLTNGNQTDPNDSARTAIPYDPTFHTLPNADTTTTTNDVACATGEPGCSSASPSCPVDTPAYSLINGVCQQTQPVSCPTNYSYSSSADACTRRNNPNVTPTCPAGPPAWTRVGGTCRNPTTVPPTPQYQHTIYGRNQIYTVSIRVKVCDGTLDMRDICTRYGSNYKPEGLLQKNAKKIRYSLFSYLTETGQQRQGGVMRARQKLIGPVTTAEQAGTETPYPDRNRIAGIDNPEWDPTTGVFIDNPDAGDATATSNNITNCGASAPDGSQCDIKYSGVINYLNRFGQINTGQPTLKSFDNLSEMYYTALRYLRGLANISAFSNLTKLSSSDLSGTNALAKYQNADGLPVIEDWYKTGANAAVTAWNASNPPRSVGTDADPYLYQCQTNVILGIGDTSTNNEEDEDDKTKDSTAAGGTWRSYTEFNVSDKPGRGNMAGLAYWAHLNDMRSDVPNNDVAGGAANAKRGQTLSTYWVDVVERNDLFAKTTNQYYNATKYGGYAIPDADWNANGNATRRASSWFDSNVTAWTTATQTVKQQTGLGGTGDYYLPGNMFLANNGQKMIDGLNTAFQKIAEDLSGSGASLAANSTKLETGTTTYQAVYFSRNWRGDLKAFAVNPSTGAIATSPSWVASAQLPSAANRVIKTYNPSASAGSQFVDFTAASVSTSSPPNLSTAQRNALGASAAEQNAIVSYLRGAATNERRNGGSYRNRETPLGDIVNSQPVFVGAPNTNIFAGKTFTGSSSYADYAASKVSRSPRIWVAANDGMLHSFHATTGAEVFAYLPNAVILADIKKLADPNYGDTGVPHQYFNDGELTVADVYYSGAWHTVLVGTTGRGTAKAVYALDVTDPNTPTLLWERSAGDGLTNSNHIGQVVGKPVIAQTANGSWSVLLGNGYNSTAGTAALLQFSITSGDLTVRTTDSMTDNGLAPPAVWMNDPTNGISTTAYAGDLSGRVWAFPLNGTSGVSLFTAVNDDDTAQPITAGMLAGKDPDTGALWLFFGTGSYLRQSDLADTTVQTWYGIIASQGIGQSASLVSNLSLGRSALRERTIVAEVAATSSTLAARAISTSSANDMNDKSGWYIDLVPPSGTAKGERMSTPNQFQGSLLIGTSRLPESSDPCNPSGSGWIMAINPFSGTAPNATFFDVNNDDAFNNSDTITVGGTTYIVAGVGFRSLPNNPIFVGNKMLISFDNASTGKISTAGTVGLARRQSWRELVAP